MATAPCHALHELPKAGSMGRAWIVGECNGFATTMGRQSRHDRSMQAHLHNVTLTCLESASPDHACLRLYGLQVDHSYHQGPCFYSCTASSESSSNHRLFCRLGTRKDQYRGCSCPHRCNRWGMTCYLAVLVSIPLAANEGILILTNY